MPGRRSGSAAYLLLLEDGPCIGSYETQRAPLALRAVRATIGGVRDVLDRLDDEPAEGEETYLYRREAGCARGHVCTRGAGCLTTLGYRFVGPLDVDTGEIAPVDTASRTWWDSQRAAAIRAWAAGDPFTPADPPTQGALFA